ncbi:peroxide stress protein YaaA [Euzebya tangerina]|uniref:peroxide stress protein YaaA n=1 Tax=Euzebya tangerina TaxID=591198 RepID=UPI000E313180|nr:peroxide stress protein YaaA [Euzebya tangerina]
MLILLSPAKSLDYESRLPTKKRSEPRMLDRSVELVDVMAQKTPADLQSLMGISEDLAVLNVQRFADFETPFTPQNARPSVLAFDGDVYQGMDAGSFGERDFTEAQKTVRILSGLYGVLRPLDLMQPYRLEMGSKLETDRGETLYEYWGTAITEQLNADLAESPGPEGVVNLASGEYFGAVDTDLLDGRLITPRFEDEKNGTYKVISFFAKRARGAMAGWLVRERVRTYKAITEFDGLGYRYDEDRSTDEQPVFTRPEG